MHEQSTTSKNIYDQLGVPEWICAGGFLTRFGGNRPSVEVRQAMSDALCGFVDLLELQAAASRVISKHTGAEAGIVTTGASAAMTLGAASMLARLDPATMATLPQAGEKSEIVVLRTHRSSYDHALRAAGATLVDVGTNDVALNVGYRVVEDWEIEAAVSSRTAGIFATARADSIAEIERLSSIAQKHSLPLMVDAAPWLPPKENLKRFIEAGATLVCVSGGKAIGGPPSSGMLAGSKDMVLSALMQQQDMTLVPSTVPEEFGRADHRVCWPKHGIGRGMKVSREQIVGFLVALEEFVQSNTAQSIARMENALEQMHNALAEAHPKLRFDLHHTAETKRRPLLDLDLGSEYVASKFARMLANGSPPVQLSEHKVSEGKLTIDPANLRDYEVTLVTHAINRALIESRTLG